ncbi:hypothetical protein LMJF_28_2700 [Leishmania major strain Friedlin]|uniref:Uncharacterized protein n=1 Tax=Leishmania major TaxID=5664 RepID=Q4Q7Z2_LEIMA|nr:hypothetical protein LMJF_28_2700 [Leishmania major strain Friedlin]CAG9577386.1 hypothetical_protein_-_conserved [Leishmania major strain Friedlin]CAJ05728.1 hypothetical protein LMJF_28_2700 [Leishmania major strain Friedlin]|eukprot:XP_001684556.1 hypothetical protein LMJF_28_2700 [Leishmania major strain Friedlin]
MSAMVLSIGIPPQERVRLCAVAAADVCQRAVAHMKAAAQCEAHDAAAEPYIRAVYVHRADSVAPERVAVASGSECGSYLRETLRATVAGIGAPSVACWLTVMLKDTCILQHAVFAISPNSKEPLKMMSPVLAQFDGAALSAGARRWSLLSAHAPGRSTSDGNVYTPRNEQPAARVITPAPAAEAGPPLSATRRRSLGTVPCSHSARTSSKTMAAAVQQPQSHAQLAPPPETQRRQQQPPRNVYEQLEKYQTDTPRERASSSRRSSRAAPPPDEDAATPHLSQNTDAAAPRLGGPGRKASTSSHPSSSVRSRQQSAVDHSTGVYSASNTSDAAALARPDSQQPPSGAQPQPGSHPPLSGVSAERPVCRPSAVSSTSAAENFGRPQAPPPNADDPTCGCPRTDLAVPSDRQQWGDWAFRTGYSPRREELWEIADAVMTHNYYDQIIENVGEPPCDGRVSSRRNKF